MKIKCSNEAVSEIVGTILLLGIAVILFSALFIFVLSSPSTPSSPSVNLIGFVDADDGGIIEHHGGDSLDLDATEILIRKGHDSTRVNAGDYVVDVNDNGKWDIGERLRYSFDGSITGWQIEADVVDNPSNSIIMSGILQEGKMIKTSPTVTTLDATHITINSTKLWMNYDFKDYDSGWVQFAYKNSTAASWTNTSWASESGSGSYNKTIKDLEGTTYHFKAQLKYDSTVIEGTQKSFTPRETTIGIWHFDEGSGNIARDSSGNDNNGTVYGASWTTGVNATALSYDGEDDYVEVPHSDSLNVTDEITIEAWMKPLGEEFIGHRIDRLKFDDDKGYEPNIIHVSGDVYTIAYRGPGKDGWLKTVNITSDGTINQTVIDTLEFDDANKSFEPNIIHVSGDVYAIAYRIGENGRKGNLLTVEIAPSGTINQTVIDTLEFDDAKCFEPNIIHVSGDVYAIAYRGPDDDGFLKNVEIAPNGSITDTVIDELEFDTDCYEPNIIHVSGDVYAIAYHRTENGGSGILLTVGIAPNGSINNTVIDTLGFDTDCDDPNIIHVSGDVYAIAYTKSNNQRGNLLTVGIAPNGSINNTVIDTFEFDPSRCYEPNIIHVSGDVYAIAYRGSVSHVGFLNTVEIATDGQITDNITDLTFHDQIAYNGNIIHVSVSDDVYVIAYTGSPAHTGYVTTIRIAAEPAYKGIYKLGAYGILANTTTAFATINEYTISGAISPGWNHIVLTYDKDAGSNQLKLYINGSLTAQRTLTEAINTNTNNLLFGDIFKGIIDEIGIYSIALLPVEVLEHYNDTRPG